MALKHRDTVRGMQGEVIIPPVEVPAVVKAIIESTEILTSRGFYLDGIEDGQRELADALKKKL